MKIQPPKKLYVSNSPIHGLGVFASEFIMSGEVVEVCPILDLKIPKDKVSDVLLDYRFNWPQGIDWDKQVMPFGWAAIYNHSNTPNTLWRSNISNQTFEFYAVKDINPDEELLVYYGDVNYWSDGRQNINVV